MPPTPRKPPKNRDVAARSATARGTAPKAAKAPTDHQEKATAKDVQTVALLGRDWTVDADALDDWELLDDLNAADQGDVTKLPAILRRFLGDDQYGDAMTLLRDPATKRITAEKGSLFFWDLMEKLNPNSERSSD